MNILKKGKKQEISNWNLANQEGNKNIKMHEIENIETILLCSGLLFDVVNNEFGLAPHFLSPPPSRTSVLFTASLYNWTLPDASLISVLFTQPLRL